MIKGNEKLHVISEKYPSLVSEFQKNGMEKWFKPENMEKLGKFIRIDTLLKSVNIDTVSFVDSLNRILQSHGTKEDFPIIDTCKSLDFLAMLPCGLRNPFKELLDDFIAHNPYQFSNFKYFAEGNVNHELSYYPLIDKVLSEDELPSISLSSDINHFFHSHFQSNFVKKGIFSQYYPYQPNKYLADVDFCDPAGNFTMITANFLVMAVDIKKLGNKKVPHKWADILSDDFKNDIIMRGEDDFFCNAVMLPLYKDHGLDAIKALANNIKAGKHPSEMVKLAGSGKIEGPSVYIIPYFFAKQISNPAVKIVWPADGAIASPVFMLIKKQKIEKHKELLDFILSKKLAEMFKDRYFPSIHPEVDTAVFPEKIKWLGWDFINQNDIGKLKTDIQDEFMKIWKNRINK